MNAEALARKVAAQLVYPISTTTKILNTAIEVIAEALAEGDTVFLMRLGRFYTKKMGKKDSRTRFGIFFRPQRSVSKKIRAGLRQGNRYYEVLATNQLALARLTGRCPRCDQPLATQEPPRCGACGELPLKASAT